MITLSHSDDDHGAAPASGARPAAAAQAARKQRVAQAPWAAPHRARGALSLSPERSSGAQCCSDPGALRGALGAAVSKSEASAQGAESPAVGSDPDVAAARVDAAAQRKSLLAELFGRAASPSQRGLAHLYLSHESEPDEDDIMDFDAADVAGDDSPARCRFVDHAAGSDDASLSADAHGTSARSKRATSAQQSWQALAPHACAKGAHHARAAPPAHQALDKHNFADEVSGDEGADADMSDLADSDGSADPQPRRRSHLSDSTAGSPASGGPAAGGIARSPHGVAHSSHDAQRRASDGYPNAEAAVPRVTAAERRRARRQRDEAEMQAAEPEVYERVMAVRQALAPYGWDKCGAFLFGSVAGDGDVWLACHCRGHARLLAAMRWADNVLAVVPIKQ